ncbi:MAG TPA: DinB family protein [Longimicrobiales bacterium]|nr:DinB family protein [Longimicrobiales bacterium]
MGEVKRARLLEKHARLERERRAFLDRVASVAPDRLRAAPAPHRWSVLQIVEHLALAEESVLASLRDEAGPRGRTRRLRHRLASLLVRALLRSPIRVPAPSRDMLPTGEDSLPAIRVRWDDLMGRLGSYLRDAEAGRLGEAPFRHPVTGPLDAAGALALTEVHRRRHVLQIDRLLGGDW